MTYIFSYTTRTENSVRFHIITLHSYCVGCTVVANNIYMLSVRYRIRGTFVGIVSGLGIGEATCRFRFSSRIVKFFCSTQRRNRLWDP